MRARIKATVDERGHLTLDPQTKKRLKLKKGDVVYIESITPEPKENVWDGLARLALEEHARGGCTSLEDVKRELGITNADIRRVTD